MLTDCHVHLASYDPGEVSEIVRRATDSDVGFIISAGTTLESSQRCVELAQHYSSVYAGVGIHPLRLRGLQGEDTYESLLRLARELALPIIWHSRVSAVGIADVTPETLRVAIVALYPYRRCRRSIHYLPNVVYTFQALHQLYQAFHLVTLLW